MSDIAALLNEYAGSRSDGFAKLAVDAAAEIERLQRRVTVLEMVISEELDPYDCCDDANEMIVKEIRERGYVRTPALASDQCGGGA